MEKESLLKMVQAMPNGSNILIRLHHEVCGLEIDATYEFSMVKSSDVFLLIPELKPRTRVINWDEIKSRKDNP